MVVEPLKFHLCESWSEVADLIHNCNQIAVDMPIGLPCLGQKRECDRLARLLLGPRRNSVFSAPGREYLNATSYAEVTGMSLQTFYLIPKIRQLDEWITPERQARVWEAHPELIFRRLAGSPLSHSKKTRQGRNQRLELLGFPELPTHFPSSRVSRDDFIDAAALLLCAGRPAHPLGEQRDPKGLLMQIRF